MPNDGTCCEELKQQLNELEAEIKKIKAAIKVADSSRFSRSWWQTQASNVVDSILPDLGPVTALAEIVLEPLASEAAGVTYDFLGPVQYSPSQSKPPTLLEIQTWNDLNRLVQEISADHEPTKDEVFVQAIESGIFDPYLRQVMHEEFPYFFEEDAEWVLPAVKQHLLNPETVDMPAEDNPAALTIYGLTWDTLEYWAEKAVNERVAAKFGESAIGGVELPDTSVPRGGVLPGEEKEQQEAQGKGIGGIGGDQPMTPEQLEATIETAVTSIDEHAALAKQGIDEHVAMQKSNLDEYNIMAKGGIDSHVALAKAGIDTHVALAKAGIDQQAASAVTGAIQNNTPTIVNAVLRALEGQGYTSS